MTVFLAHSALADRYLLPHKRGDTSYFSECFGLYQSANPETLDTGLDNTNVAFVCQADNASSGTAMTEETIATIGTFAQPTSASHIRFAECDTTAGENGTYQIMLHDDLVATANAKSITCRAAATGMMDEALIVNLNVLDAADIENEADDALVARDLDHLINVAESGDVVNNSIVAKLAASDGVFSGYDNSTDALEALRDKINTVPADVGARNAEDQDGGYSYDCIMALMLAYVAGEWALSGSAATYQDPGGAENRIVGTISASARTAITISCPTL